MNNHVNIQAAIRDYCLTNFLIPNISPFELCTDKT